MYHRGGSRILLMGGGGVGGQELHITDEGEGISLACDSGMYVIAQLHS